MRAVVSSKPAPTSPSRMVLEMYRALPVFLNQPHLVVWFTQERAFACLRMETSEGERWGLPFGTVVQSEQEARDQAQAFLESDAFERFEPLSLRELKAGLPAHWDSVYWPDNTWKNYGSPLGIGLFLHKLNDAPLDEEAVVRAFAQYSCHPYFGKRVVQDLNQTGERITTVTAGFVRTLGELSEACEAVGVGVCLTWPRPGCGVSELPEGVDSSYEAYLQ